VSPPKTASLDYRAHPSVTPIRVPLIRGITGVSPCTTMGHNQRGLPPQWYLTGYAPWSCLGKRPHPHGPKADLRALDEGDTGGFSQLHLIPSR